MGLMSPLITRRQFLVGASAAGFGLLVGCGQLPWQAPAPAAVRRIGYLATSPSADEFESFRQGLLELGYVEGENLIIDRRYSDGHTERFPDLAAELVGVQAHII